MANVFLHSTTGLNKKVEFAMPVPEPPPMDDIPSPVAKLGIGYLLNDSIDGGK